MAEFALNDLLMQAYPDNWEFIRIKGIRVHPGDNRWQIQYTAPKPLKLDDERLILSLRENLGFVQKVALKRELPERLDGNAYDPATVTRAIAEGRIQPLARNLTNATTLFEQSEVAREYLGADFVEHYIATRRWEVSEYEKAVTNWERRRYFELI